MIKRLIKKLIPKSVLLFYHHFLAVSAAFLYGQPSQKLIIIGVTGTAGKSTVVNLIGRILEEAGYQVGWTSTISFKIGQKEWLNKTKMTMLGRLALQKFLSKMVQANCQYAIIETSSEGILQSRHLGINYDLAVFTNLYPEHLEVHGGFENYKRTKGKLFQKLKDQSFFAFNKTKVIKGQKIKKVIIANLDDENVDYFLSFPADEYWGYTTNYKFQFSNSNFQIVRAKNIQLDSDGSRFVIHDFQFQTHLPGKFNVQNVLAAICVGLSQGVTLEIIRTAFKKIKKISGRMEVVINKPFQVIVDYAHTPDELKNVYQTIVNSFQLTQDKHRSKIICVLGSAGGGRDKWKRPVLGKIAAQYCDFIILTNEDPYDENPNQILSEIKNGILGQSFRLTNLYTILDRRLAIKKSLTLAKTNDIVIITGKGCEQWICEAGGQKIPWDDRKVIKEEWGKCSFS